MAKLAVCQFWAHALRRPRFCALGSSELPEKEVRPPCWGDHLESPRGARERPWDYTKRDRVRVILAEPPAPSEPARWNRSHSGLQTGTDRTARLSLVQTAEESGGFLGHHFWELLLRENWNSVHLHFKSVPSFDKYKTHPPTRRFRCSPVFLHTLVTTCFGLIIRVNI